jgi:hypothetical protein
VRVGVVSPQMVGVSPSGSPVDMAVGPDAFRALPSHEVVRRTTNR